MGMSDGGSDYREQHSRLIQEVVVRVIIEDEREKNKPVVVRATKTKKDR